jgi:putative chitinase
MDWARIIIRTAKATEPASRPKPLIVDGVAAELPDIFRHFDISTPRRQAHFIAQSVVECMWYQTLREVWGPTPTQRRYEGRKDLGNTRPGDGKRFMGRGIFQNTGRTNYELVQTALRHLNLASNCITIPEELERPKDAAWAAGIYWQKNRLNAVAERDGTGSLISRAVNRGNANSPKKANHEEVRCRAFQHALTQIAAENAREAAALSPLMTSVSGVRPAQGDQIASVGASR